MFPLHSSFPCNLLVSLFPPPPSFPSPFPSFPTLLSLVSPTPLLESCTTLFYSLTHGTLPPSLFVPSPLRSSYTSSSRFPLHSFSCLLPFPLFPPPPLLLPSLLSPPSSHSCLLLHSSSLTPPLFVPGLTLGTLAPPLLSPHSLSSSHPSSSLFPLPLLHSPLALAPLSSPTLPSSSLPLLPYPSLTRVSCSTPRVSHHRFLSPHPWHSRISPFSPLTPFLLPPIFIIVPSPLLHSPLALAPLSSPTLPSRSVSTPSSPLAHHRPPSSHHLPPLSCPSFLPHPPLLLPSPLSQPFILTAPPPTFLSPPSSSSPYLLFHYCLSSIPIYPPPFQSKHLPLCPLTTPLLRPTFTSIPLHIPQPPHPYLTHQPCPSIPSSCSASPPPALLPYLLLPPLPPTTYSFPNLGYIYF